MLPLALACSACGDAIFLAKAWWAPAVGLVLLSMLAEAAVLVVFSRVRKAQLTASRGPFAAVAAVLVVVCVGAGLSTWVALWAASGVLALGSVRSLVRNLPLGRPLAAVRVAMLLGGLGLGLLAARPAQRDVDELISKGASAARLKVTEGWLFDELRRRPEVGPRLVERLATANDERFVVLHAALGFPVGEREAACARLVADKRTFDRGVCP